jgi:coat protein B
MKNLKYVSASLLAAMAATANTAMAAVDVAGVSTAIGVAETSAHSIGTVVIGVVAGLAVVGIVLGLVRKL